MLEGISWIITFIALYGTYLNVNQDKTGFYYWLISNSCFCVINFLGGTVAQGFLFGIYTILSIIGIRNWKD
ncbi:MAG: nicotinamide mononucleotide transporter family protein [Parachlamydia sp.]|nr:nicotinamide mononucleotide transporter family protein [Parachlamydia sp.]